MLKTDVCRKHTHRMDLVRKRDLVLLTGISSVLQRIPWTEEPRGLWSNRVAKSPTRLKQLNMQARTSLTILTLAASANMLCTRR